jgi:hypothetical protein
MKFNLNWPNDFDGAHQVGGVSSSPKIYESPDGGKTIYEREFGSTERRLIKSAVEQQWNITFNGMKV